MAFLREMFPIGCKVEHQFIHYIRGLTYFKGTVLAVTRSLWVRVLFEDGEVLLVHPRGIRYYVGNEARLPEYRPSDPVPNRGDVLVSNKEVIKELKVGINAPIINKKKKLPPLRRRRLLA